MTDRTYQVIVRGLTEAITRDCKIPVQQLVDWLRDLDNAADLLSDYDEAYDLVIGVEVEIATKIKQIRRNIEYGEELKRKL